VCAGHGWGLGSGLFLDDHSHFARLRASDWSFRSAVDSARLGIVGDVLDVWGRHEAGLRFFRPIAFWTMKIEYTLTGWRPWAMHALSLGWHWLASMLVAALAWRCLGRIGWAAVAGGIFAVHPGQVACTYWVASQTELQVTVWLLLGILCYARYSAWPSRLFAQREDWYPNGRPDRALYVWLIPTSLCFAMALGSRENAVMFLPLIFVGDLIFCAATRIGFIERLRRLRWGAYVLLTVVVGVYLALRWRMLEGFPLPGKPYLITPSDPGFWPFIADKFVLNMLAIFAYVPVVPLGGLAYFQERQSSFYLPFAGVIVGWVILLWLFRRRPGIILAFSWLVLMMLPLLPVFSSPHHLYMPNVGFALILASALGLAGGCFREGDTSVGGRRSALNYVIVGLHAVGLTFGCWAMGWVYRSSTAIEDLVLADVRGNDVRPIRDGDHLFLINIPMMAYYVVPAYEQETGLRDLKGHALTFSPNPLIMDQPSRAVAIDEHTLRISIEGDSYFSGMTGRVALDIMGIDHVPEVGESFDAGLYRVTVERGDENGIEALLFRFTRPLNSPDFHFFFASRERLAYPLSFEPHQRIAQTAPNG